MHPDYEKKQRALANQLMPKPVRNVAILTNFSDDEQIEVEIPLDEYAEPPRELDESTYADCLTHLSNHDKLRKYVQATAVASKPLTLADLDAVTAVTPSPGTAAVKVNLADEYRIDLSEDFRKVNKNPHFVRFDEYRVHEIKVYTHKHVYIYNSYYYNPRIVNNVNLNNTNW